VNETTKTIEQRKMGENKRDVPVRVNPKSEAPKMRTETST